MVTYIIIGINILLFAAESMKGGAMKSGGRAQIWGPVHALYSAGAVVQALYFHVPAFRFSAPDLQYVFAV